MEPFSIILLFAVLIPLLLLWVLTIVDIVRRADLHMWKKGAWSAVVVLLPLIGVLLYATLRPLPPARGKERDVAGAGTIADRLELIVDAHAGGDLDDEAFVEAKRALFGL